MRKNLARLLLLAQAYEWALLWLESPTKGVGEKWRVQTPRSVERALKVHIDSLKARIKSYGLDPSFVKPIELAPGSKIPRKKLPDNPFAEEAQDIEAAKDLEYKFGGNDPRLEKLSALELLSLSRHGTKEPDPDL